MHSSNPCPYSPQCTPSEKLLVACGAEYHVPCMRDPSQAAAGGEAGGAGRAGGGGMFGDGASVQHESAVHTRAEFRLHPCPQHGPIKQGQQVSNWGPGWPVRPIIMDSGSFWRPVRPIIGALDPSGCWQGQSSWNCALAAMRLRALVEA